MLAKKSEYDILQTKYPDSQHMVTERLIPGAVKLVEEPRPIFETEGQRRVYKHPLFFYYPDDRCILKNGRNIYLTLRENSIFTVFVENASQVISHVDIGVSDNVLRQYIGIFKREIQPRPEDPQIIYSIGQKRYILEDPSRLSDKQDFSGFVYRHKRHSVDARDSREVFLTIREKKVLDFLIIHAGEVVEKDAIVKALYEDKEGLTLLQIQWRVGKYIQGLRQKIGDFEQEDGTFRFIVLVRGKGYKLTDPVLSA